MRFRSWPELLAAIPEEGLDILVTHGPPLWHGLGSPVGTATVAIFNGVFEWKIENPGWQISGPEGRFNCQKADETAQMADIPAQMADIPPQMADIPPQMAYLNARTWADLLPQIAQTPIQNSSE